MLIKQTSSPIIHNIATQASDIVYAAISKSEHTATFKWRATIDFFYISNEGDLGLPIDYDHPSAILFHRDTFEFSVEESNAMDSVISTSSDTYSDRTLKLLVGLSIQAFDNTSFLGLPSNAWTNSI